MSETLVGALLPLFVAVPLAIASLAALIRSGFVRVILSLIVPVLTGCCAFALFLRTAGGQPIGHSVGGFPGGVAIPFVADALSMLLLTVLAVVVLVANWFAAVVYEHASRFYATLTLMMLAGASGALLTADLFNFFVFMEVMLLPSYGLIAVTGTWRRLAAGRSFVLVNLLTSTLLLAGVALIYGSAGTVSIAQLAGVAAQGGPTTVALGLVILALCVKAGLAPAHTWLPRTYPNTSPAVMGLFSAVHTKVAVYMLIRIYVVIVDLNPAWQWPIIVVTVISMIVGAYAGLGERTMREILAYQMVNGMPFILIVLAFTSGNAKAALSAGVFYAIHHMVTVGSLILAAGAVEETYGTGTLARLSGLARRDHAVAWVMAAMSLSLVGFPPFSGMWGKVAVLFTAAHGEGARSVIAVCAIILASLGALLSMVRLWRAVFWGRPMQGVNKELCVRGSMIAPAASLAMASVALFAFVGWATQATGAAADAVLDIPSYARAALGEPVAAVGGFLGGAQ